MNTVRTKLSTDWVFYPSKISVFLRAGCAFAVYSTAPDLKHCMWNFSLFLQHYYSVYESPTCDVFCLSIFIASSSAIKPLWAVLYTSEQVLWPDGRCDKWGEVSEALSCTRALRLTVLPSQGQGLSTPRLWARWQRTPLWGHPWAAQGLLCLNCLAVPLRPAPESQNLTKMFAKAKTPVKMFSVFLPEWQTWLLL